MKSKFLFFILKTFSNVRRNEFFWKLNLDFAEHKFKNELNDKYKIGLSKALY